jgi:hypothetical protein
MAALLETKNLEEREVDRLTAARSATEAEPPTRGPHRREPTGNDSRCLNGAAAEVNEERSSPDRDVDEAMTTCLRAMRWFAGGGPPESGMVVKMTRGMISSRPTA